MKNKYALIIYALIFVLLIGGSYLLYNGLKDRISSDQLTALDSEQQNPDESTDRDNSETAPAQDEAALELETAPDFTVYTESGSAVKLSDYFGKPIVLNFWASWCGPCKGEMPDFERMYKKSGDEITFLLVNMTDNSRETVSVAASFIRSQGYTFPVFYDTAQNAANTYQVYSIPSTYFINARGQLVARASGAIDEATLEQGINMIK